MVYLKMLAKRSWDEVWEVVVSDSLRTVIVALVIIVGGGVATNAIRGLDSMWDYLFGVAIVAGVTMFVFALLYVPKFLYLAPRDMWREEKNKKEEILKQIADSKRAPIIIGKWKRDKFFGSTGVLTIKNKMGITLRVISKKEAALT
jgi:putative copper export protein